MKFRKICIIGLGYIGLPTAAIFSNSGVNVVGVDINPMIVSELKKGHLHIEETGLTDLVIRALDIGNLKVAATVEFADAFIIAVPTPFYEDKRADLSSVKAATEAIVPHLKQGNLVVLESTSPPNTTIKLLLPILETSGLKAGVDFFLAYTPERVLPGQILKELVENPRVIGGINPRSAEEGRDLYSIIVKGDITLTDSTTAEMVKLMENTYRDINIAIANEFSRLAYRFGVDIWEAIQIANKHPRVKILNPGPGVGGHCISVDPWFFVESAPDITPLIRTARNVNDSQPHFVLEMVKKECQSVKQLSIALLGLSFKPDVDDIRESPAFDLAHLLQNEGANVLAYEPHKPAGVYGGITNTATLSEALSGANIIILAVGHKEFLGLSPEQLKVMSPARVFFDAVNALHNAPWSNHGFGYYRLGVGTKAGFN